MLEGEGYSLPEGLSVREGSLGPIEMLGYIIWEFSANGGVLVLPYAVKAGDEIRSTLRVVSTA